MKNKGFSYIVLIIGVFFLATSAIFAKVAEAPATIIAFYRLAFTTIVLMPVVILNKKIRRELFSLSIKQILFGLLSGMFLAVHYVMWFESLNYTSVASSTVIVTLQPIFSVIGCYVLYKEKLNIGSIMGILLAISGSVIIGWGDFNLDGQALFGDFLALFSAGVITAYFFVGQYLRKNISVITYSFVGYVSSTIFLGLYGLKENLSFVGYSKTTWMMFIGLALISTILGQMMLNWVIKWLNTSIVSVGILSETVWAIIFSYFILKEKISILQGSGIGVILIGLFVFSMKYKPKKKDVFEEVEMCLD